MLKHMNFDWNEIRSLNGSQAEGFEELCAQLARLENPQGAVFLRKGTPDAGVECFSVLSDGSEWGWQAKYFHRLGASQWAQIDKSVKKALSRHPSLARYFVCIPLNLPDARTDGQKSAMEQWEIHVEKWKGWATGMGRDVAFEWWGSSELLDRLSRRENIGRVFFWFGKQGFEDSWFTSRFTEAAKAAGPRYSPEVHVGLPIAKELDAFGRTESSFLEIKSLARRIRREFKMTRYTNTLPEGGSALAQFDNFHEAISEVLRRFSSLDFKPVGKIPFQDIAGEIEKAEVVADGFSGVLSQNSRDYEKENPSGERRSYDKQNPFDELLHITYRLQSELRDARVALIHADGIGNSNLMVLRGDAGTGKTHLLCDTAQRWVEKGAPTLLLMGQRFTETEDPWSQVLKQLDLPGASVEAFVGAFEAKAQAANCRAVLIIDAINEGQGRKIWPANLAAFLVPLERSPWISVLLSVRTTYEEVILPPEVRSQAFIITHNGFAGHEYDATRTFFSHYGLEFPSTPILQPEFSNPLFLKTICRGLHEDGEKRLPRGFHGISSAFELYIQSVEKSLASAEALDFNPRDGLVRQSLESIAKVMVEKDLRWLDRATAEETVNQHLPGRGYAKSLYGGLVSEGVLIEDVIPSRKTPPEETVCISFERYADHIIANILLQAHLDPADPEAAFAKGGGLAFLSEASTIGMEGVCEALCIQLPERVGAELVRLAPSLAERWWMGGGF